MPYIYNIIYIYIYYIHTLQGSVWTSDPLLRLNCSTGPDETDRGARVEGVEDWSSQTHRDVERGSSWNNMMFESVMERPVLLTITKPLDVRCF